MCRAARWEMSRVLAGSLRLRRIRRRISRRRMGVCLRCAVISAVCGAGRPDTSIDFLESQLKEKSRWLVRRYRRELRWDRRTDGEQEELREILRATTRGIQFPCVKLIVRRLNELAITSARTNLRSIISVCSLY